MDEEKKSIQALIAEVGIPISKDDPVYIQFALMNHQLSQWAQKQEELLIQFQQELLSCRMAWEQEAQEKAERVMNFALKTGRERLEETTTECLQQLRSQQIDPAERVNSAPSGGLLVALGIGMLMLQLACTALLLMWLR